MIYSYDIIQSYAIIPVRNLSIIQCKKFSITQPK